MNIQKKLILKKEVHRNLKSSNLAAIQGGNSEYPFTSGSHNVNPAQKAQFMKHIIERQHLNPNAGYGCQPSHCSEGDTYWIWE